MVDSPDLVDFKREADLLRDLCRRQQLEIADLTGLADAVDVLRDIGKLVGCGHVDSSDERRQLVNCVERELDRLKSRPYHTLASAVRELLDSYYMGENRDNQVTHHVCPVAIKELREAAGVDD